MTKATKKMARAEAFPERRRLYDSGLLDNEIAAIEGRASQTIQIWRERRGLPTNLPRGRNRRSLSKTPGTPETKRRCLALLERGVNGGLIAREMGLASSTIDRWRNVMLAERPGLSLPKYEPRPTRRHANGNAFSKLRPDRRAAAFLLYADGSDYGTIADALGITHQQVWKWRQALYLPAVRPRGGVSRGETAKRARKPLGAPISPLSNPLHARIMSAIGRALPPDLTDDAASEMWLAMLEGRLKIDQIEAQARRFRGRAIADYASRYGPTSLDEDLTGDGFRLLDVLRDDRSSNWLEEQGATVW